MYSLIPVFCAHDIMSLVRALPGSAAQGLIWGIMAIGVFLTFKILDFADLTVDGSFGTGGAVTVMLILAGYSPIVAVGIAFLAGILAGMVTGILHTVALIVKPISVPKNQYSSAIIIISIITTVRIVAGLFLPVTIKLYISTLTAWFAFPCDIFKFTE